MQHFIARTTIQFKRIVYNQWFQFNLCHWTSNNLPNKENILTKNVQWIPFRILMFYFVCHTNLQSMNVSNNHINKYWKLFFIHAFQTSLHYGEGIHNIRYIVLDLTKKLSYFYLNLSFSNVVSFNFVCHCFGDHYNHHLIFVSL